MSQHIHHQYIHYTPPQSYQHQFSIQQNTRPTQQTQHVIVPQIQQQHLQPEMTLQQQQVQTAYQQQVQQQQQQQQQQQSTMQMMQQGAPIVQQQPTASTSAAAQASGPLIATGDWTKDLVHLAKTAELKKHALTLQLHTAHILSAHASLDQKAKAMQDLREQKNKLESERTRLLNCLRDVNADRDKVDLMESTLEKECQDTRTKIQQLTEGDYAVAKADVDRLRAELGQPPLPSLQSTLEEKSAQYLNERRLSGVHDSAAQSGASSAIGTPAPSTSVTASISTGGTKRPSSALANGPSAGPGSLQHGEASGTPVKRPRGRPKGSKNKKSTDAA